MAVSYFWAFPMPSPAMHMGNCVDFVKDRIRGRPQLTVFWDPKATCFSCLQQISVSFKSWVSLKLQLTQNLIFMRKADQEYPSIMSSGLNLPAGCAVYSLVLNLNVCRVSAGCLIANLSTFAAVVLRMIWYLTFF